MHEATAIARAETKRQNVMHTNLLCYKGQNALETVQYGSLLPYSGSSNKLPHMQRMIKFKVKLITVCIYW